MEYTVDLTGIENREEFHDRLADGLQLPEYYGRNLDALFDCLTERSGIIMVYGTQDAEEALAGYFQGFRMVCLDAMDENPDIEILFFN